MRIKHSGPQPAAELESNRAPNEQAAGGLSRGSGTAEDQAQLSGAHTRVQALAAQTAQLPEIRGEKVQSLREALAHGQLRLQPEMLAGALISHMLVEGASARRGGQMVESNLSSDLSFGIASPLPVKPVAGNSAKENTPGKVAPRHSQSQGGRKRGGVRRGPRNVRASNKLA